MLLTQGTVRADIDSGDTGRSEPLVVGVWSRCGDDDTVRMGRRRVAVAVAVALYLGGGVML